MLWVEGCVCRMEIDVDLDSAFAEAVGIVSTTCGMKSAQGPPICQL